MSMSKLDSNQINKLTYDSVNNANRMTMVSTDIAIELSAADGDSVIAKSQSTALLIINDQVVDLSMVNSIMFVSQDVVTVGVFLVIDGDEIEVYNSIPTNTLTEICLTTAKFVFSSLDPVYLLMK